MVPVITTVKLEPELLEAANVMRRNLGEVISLGQLMREALWDRVEDLLLRGRFGPELTEKLRSCQRIRRRWMTH